MQRRIPIAIVTAVTALVLTVGITVPAHAASPSASATAVVDGTTATVTYTLNRAPHQIRSQVCTLDGQSTLCDTSPEAIGKSSAFEVLLTALPVGEHNFAVTFHLTDGGTATATTTFTIATSQTLEEICAGFTGTLTIDPAPGIFWSCVADPYQGPLDRTELFNAAAETFPPYCPEGGIVATIPDEPVLALTVTCT
jgi:hypothetical protein